MASIRKRGNRWQAQIRRAGRQSLSKTFASKKNAQAWVIRMERELEERDVGRQKNQIAGLNLADLVARYRRDVLPLKRAPEREDIMLNAFMRDPVARLSLADLGPTEFAAYRDKRLRTVKAATVCRELGLLRHCLEIARRDWGIPLSANPLEGVRRPRLPPGRKRRLNSGEEDRLMKAAANCRNPEIPLLIVLALETAMRLGELLRIRALDIDQAAGLLYVPETKNGEARTVPLSERAFSVLSTRGEQGPSWRVFQSSVSAVKQSWRRCRNRAGLVDLRFHDLRHEAISRMIEMGLTVPEAAAISGHKDPRVILRYAHPTATTLRAKLISFGGSNRTTEQLVS